MGLDRGRDSCVAVAVTARARDRGDRDRAASGKEKEIVEIAGAKFEHHVGHRARMGRVLPEKLKPPYTLRVQQKGDAAE